MQNLLQHLTNTRVVKTPVVIEAMLAVDRRDFVPANTRGIYEDHPCPTMHDQTLSAPHMHAIALEILHEHAVPGASVLDVGSGSGYLCACFAEMMKKDGHVSGVEVYKELVDWSISNISKNHKELFDDGILDVHVGNGWKGDTKYQPFDAIHVGAAASALPVELVNQLKPGGRLVIPIFDKKVQHSNLTVVDKTKDGDIHTKTVLAVNYVPLVNRDP